MSSNEIITMSHGSGAGLDELLKTVILPALELDKSDSPLEDAALIPVNAGKIAFTTDSFVVSPRTFPGGNIGKLAACGTINDIAVIGAKPIALSVALIIEEGLSFTELREHLVSLCEECKKAEVAILCGDTKVVDRGKGDGLFINTTGIGIHNPLYNLSAANAAEGDLILVSGTIGWHGITIMAQRESLDFASNATSDCAALNNTVVSLLEKVPLTRVIRDATRGGCAAVCNEIAKDSNVTFKLDEELIPVDPIVASASDFLGLDPLQIANEGRFIAVIPKEYRDQALEALHNDPHGTEAVIIGEVIKKDIFPVVMETGIGGSRSVEIPQGQLLPRIC